VLIRSSAFIASILFIVSWVATAQEPLKPTLTPHIITATKQVAVFTGLEKQMLQAIQKKDKAALEAMLDEDFAIEMPDADSLAGPDWVDSIMAKDFTLKSFIIRQMSAVQLGDAVLVNYDRVQEATSKGNAVSGEFFVVDLWKKAGDSWKLANRYVAKVTATPVMPKADKRPTGKQ
jgi:ketosteroid isomerase-like protein